MKVVLFCGGYGMRMRDGRVRPAQADDDGRPAPADLARHALLRALRAHRLRAVPRLRRPRTSRTTSSTTTRRRRTTSCCAAARSSCCGSDIRDWRITFVHTGLDSPIGERLRRVRKYVEDEEMFLANYADVLTDMPLDDMLDRFSASRQGRRAARGAAAVGVPLPRRGRGRHGRRRSAPFSEMPIWENGGYFVLRPEIFDYIPENGDLVVGRLRWRWPRKAA